jgi:hypothetical protein
VAYVHFCHRLNYEDAEGTCSQSADCALYVLTRGCIRGNFRNDGIGRLQIFVFIALIL